MGNDSVGLLREGNYRTPPARANTEVANRDESNHGNSGDERGSSNPAEALFHRFAAFHALLADVRGKRGPAVFRRIDGSAFFMGSLEESVSPVTGIETEGTDISAHNAFAEDAAGKLLISILFQRDKVALADLGDRSDLLERDTARNSLRPKLFPKSTHLVTSPDIIA